MMAMFRKSVWDHELFLGRYILLYNKYVHVLYRKSPRTRRKCIAKVCYLSKEGGMWSTPPPLAPSALIHPRTYKSIWQLLQHRAILKPFRIFSPPLNLPFVYFTTTKKNQLINHPIKKGNQPFTAHWTP